MQSKNSLFFSLSSSHSLRSEADLENDKLVIQIHGSLYLSGGLVEPLMLEKPMGSWNVR